MDSKEKALREEFAALQTKLQNPAIYSSKEYPALARRQAELQRIVNLFDEKNRLSTQLEQARKLANSNDEELAKIAKNEVELLQQKVTNIQSQISNLLLPKDSNDERDAIVEIRAAAGGDEAALFGGDLYRMYVRWCERRGFKTELLGESPSEAGGFKEIIFMVRGDEAYKNLKFEAGVHRVQRVPVTESSGRIHTSTATVAVLPEAEETDIEIKPEEIRVDVFRSSGPGGQSVNTTDSAVRITHLPTGVIATSQDEKSQIKNRAKAMSVLRARLLKMKIDNEQQNLSQARQVLIGSGGRSEKIRTYNFPQDRITDHRIGYSRSNLPGALDGDFDDITKQLQAKELELIRGEQ